MKKYVIISLILALVAISCSNDGENRAYQWVGKNSVSGLTLYRGATGGGVAVPLKNDSLKRIIMDTTFRKVYSERKYDLFSVEIENSSLTYIDPITRTKVVSTYEFRDDSLFVHLSSGNERFVALGNLDSLYLIESYYRFPAEDGASDIEGMINKELELNDVLKLAGFADLEDLTLRKDTLRWCNIKFVFKK